MTAATYRSRTSLPFIGPIKSQKATPTHPSHPALSLWHPNPAFPPPNRTTTSCTTCVSQHLLPKSALCRQSCHCAGQPPLGHGELLQSCFLTVATQPRPEPSTQPMLLQSHSCSVTPSMPTPSSVPSSRAQHQPAEGNKAQAATAARQKQTRVSDCSYQGVAYRGASAVYALLIDECSHRQL